MSSDPNRFPWHARSMAYHAQMRMQNLAIKDTAAACYIVCIESAEPYPIQVYQLTDKALQEGEKCLIAWSERLKIAEQSSSYPPYTTCIMPLDVPDEEPDLIFEDDDNG